MKMLVHQRWLRTSACDRMCFVIGYVWIQYKIACKSNICKFSCIGKEMSKIRVN